MAGYFRDGIETVYPEARQQRGRIDERVPSSPNQTNSLRSAATHAR
jgi:hypothetical protein